MKGQTNKLLLEHKTQRKLRRRMTDAELRLWRYLRGRQMSGYKFRRQHPFEDYVLDFVCLEARLVIEADGGQHALRATEDDERTKSLNAAGFRVLRFWNNEILNNGKVVQEAIWCALTDPSPSQTPPRRFACSPP